MRIMLLHPQAGREFLYVGKKVVNYTSDVTDYPEDAVINFGLGIDLMNDFVERGSCKEIILSDILCLLEYAAIPSFISSLKQLMRKGCVVQLMGIDLAEVSKMHVRSLISDKTFSEILMTYRPISAYNLAEVSKVLSQAGLKITKKRLDGYKYLVEAELI